MLSGTLKPLRTTLVGLGLFAGMASAQAQLLMTFLEDSANGQVSIEFSGQTTADFDVTSGLSGTVAEFLDGYAFTHEQIGEVQGYSTVPLTMTYAVQLPVVGNFGPSLSNIGNGGFYYSGGVFILVSATSASAGESIEWDGISTYEGSLADIDLEEGDFGTLVFTYGEGSTFTIDWKVAAVPEPSTYALVLGLGVAGVALLRRRASRR